MRSHCIFHSFNSTVINVHAISRAVDRKMIFDDVAKEKETTKAPPSHADHPVTRGRAVGKANH